jgi:hypothetical protein
MHEGDREWAAVLGAPADAGAFSLPPVENRTMSRFQASQTIRLAATAGADQTALARASNKELSAARRRTRDAIDLTYKYLEMWRAERDEAPDGSSQMWWAVFKLDECSRRLEELKAEFKRLDGELSGRAKRSKWGVR